MWYAARMLTLWVLLIALPFAVMVTGCVTLARNWRDDMNPPKAAQQTVRRNLPGPGDALRRRDDIDGRSYPCDCRLALAAN
jgi:hypothetical protein